ncbi:MAG: prolyl oligopeptidase family serine peptidase [Gammaproteobacteria bacterium]|nr:prolyl oligopeptidase family serine peptidase [Gammaproteobacteria bacterium]
MLKSRSVVFAFVLCAVSIARAEELPPLEAYAALPETSMMEISPDGTRVAMRVTSPDRDVILAMDLATNDVIAGANAGVMKPRNIRFPNNDILLLMAGKRVNPLAVKSAYEHNQAYSLTLSEQKVRSLLTRAKNLYPFQSGIGKVIGAAEDGKVLYMPAYHGKSNPRYGIYAVRLDIRRDRLIEKGNHETKDWFVDSNGVPIVREDYDDEEDFYSVWRLGEGKEKDVLLYSEETEIRPAGPVGLSSDGKSLVILRNLPGRDIASYFLMSLDDGAITGPVFGREDADIDYVITDINRVVTGIRYSGFKPDYHFFDDELDARVKKIQSRLPDLSVQLVSASKTRERLIFLVKGGWSSGHYLLFEGDDNDPQSISRERPGISREHVAKTYIDSYSASDGLEIPALITARESVYEAGNAALIVMPHGGPESYDRFGFNWKAQYLASRGYVVLQPQFRGSSGFGDDFVNAGHGEWGGRMQSDLHDGVRYLVESGKVDASRVCIVGSSYGGYAALAAGAFAPEMYKCVVSIAGVSDLEGMIKEARRNYGSDHWIVSYWEQQYGTDIRDRELMRSISPLHHAGAFQSPVLLIHGKDDTIVPIKQSKSMRNALRKAGKSVEFVELNGEDHYLSKYETRLKAMQAIAKFIEQHL